LRLRALVLVAALSLCACKEDLGFGVALTLELDPRVDATVVSKLQVVASGDESDQVVYDFPRRAFQKGEERVIYRPRPATRSLHLELVARDITGSALALGNTPTLSHEPGETTSVTVTLAPPDAGTDLAFDNDGGRADAGSPPSFETSIHNEYSGQGPVGPAIAGDFDCDGHRDIVFAGTGAGGGPLGFLGGNGKGGFAAPAPFGLGSIGVSQLVALRSDAGDCDDLVYVEASPFTIVHAFLGGPSGATGPGATVALTVQAGVAALAAGDFTGDGYDDIVISTFGDELQIFAASVGTYSGFVTTTGVPHGPLAVGDFDHDGKNDVAIIGATGLAIYRGDGAGGLTAVGTPIATSATMIVAGKLDGDDYSDLAIASAGPNIGVQLLFGTSTGEVTLAPASADLARSDNYFHALAAGELSGDGNIDLVSLGDSITVHRSKHDGAFQPPLRYGPVYSGPQQPVIADFDEDGAPDVATIALSGSTGLALDVLLGAGNGELRAVRRPIGGKASLVAVGDLHGDGVADDLAAATARPGPIYAVETALGARPSRYLAEPVRYPELFPTFGLAVGKFDGDAFGDYATATSDGTYFRYLDASGNVVSSPPRIATASLGVVAGDLNGDQRAEVIALDASSGPPYHFWVYTANANQAFTDAMIMSPLTDRPVAAALGHFDKDDQLDLVVTTEGDRAVVFMGLGNGMFNQVGDYVANTKAHGVAVGDLDNDGLVDFVTANSGSASLSVFKNLGMMQFANAIDVPVAGVLPGKIAIADLDQDGIVDVVVTDTQGPQVWVLRGRAVGFDPPVGFFAGSPQTDLAIADLDGDGRLDLIVAAGGVHVLYNTTP
jgi:hypothetical protein